MYYKVFPSIANRIVSVEDLNDFYAYMDDLEIVGDYKSQEEYLDNLPTFLFPLKNCNHIEELTNQMNYEVGRYNLNNVKRILGCYFGKEKRMLVIEA